MSSAGPTTLDLADLRRLLRDAERDVAALSREEAERILQIRDPDLRLKAYIALRESWGRGGDRLLPDDEARILVSLASLNSPELAPVPRPPAPAMPLTPLSLVAWSARWRVLLIESGLRRAASLGSPTTPAALEAIASSQDDVREAERFPEIAILRLLDALARELQEGLQSRLLLPDEALSGHVTNLAGLLRSVVAAKAKRLIPIPPTPVTPPLRSSIGEILSWLEALLAFEEAVGSRALLEAGVAVEPADAAARFRAAARQGAPDVLGHASSQLSSWRRADRAHRAVAAAQSAGWLNRDRPVSLPSFDVGELERWFGAFAVPCTLPAVPAPAAATPAAVHLYWSERRHRALRRIALTLLADGVVAEVGEAEEQALAIASARSGAFFEESREVQRADQVMALCERLLVSGTVVAGVSHADDAEAVIAAWGAKRLQRDGSSWAISGQALVPIHVQANVAPSNVGNQALDRSAAASPLIADKATASVVSPAPAAPLEVVADSPNRASAGLAVPDGQEVVARQPYIRRMRDRLESTLASVSSVTAAGAAVACSSVLYQGAVIAYAGAAGGVHASASEVVLRSALLTDPKWFLSGVPALAALVVVLPEIRRLPSLVRGRGWGWKPLLRLAVAGGLVAGGAAIEPPRRFVFTDTGLPAWPERVVEQGGVPTSTLNPAEGTWLARRVVEAMRADDTPTVAPGQPSLVLLREVGLLGGFRGWWLANAPESEAVAGRSAAEFATAPSVVERKNNLR